MQSTVHQTEVLLFFTLLQLSVIVIAARRSGMSPQEAKAIGIMMNTRALMELVVINVGMDLGAIPPDVFTMLVIMAIASTVVTTPALKIWLSPGKRGKLEGVGQP